MRPVFGAGPVLLAIKAADHLNRLGDFTYRNHYLGARTITLTKIWFKPFSSELAPGAQPSLDVVGATAVNMGKGKLQIVVYQEKNKKPAKARAVSIKKYLLEKFPSRADRDISISWFDQTESEHPAVAAAVITVQQVQAEHPVAAAIEVEIQIIPADTVTQAAGDNYRI